MSSEFQSRHTQARSELSKLPGSADEPPKSNEMAKVVSPSIPTRSLKNRTQKNHSTRNMGALPKDAVRMILILPDRSTTVKDCLKTTTWKDLQAYAQEHCCSAATGYKRPDVTLRVDDAILSGKNTLSKRISTSCGDRDEMTVYVQIV
ncbi:hypothetical protein CYMTET_37084 [Cymbomonas tetramitiformis]|uniref:Uncharacterized protein n=1 Tax=Cymbomonas tetramitiformis TaxID=36881 RepID=A0AAE0F7Q0_9CHLO|nr:hypothetical protein CYMTET_37084 [Cymbomonas tetramitiformis]